MKKLIWFLLFLSILQNQCVQAVVKTFVNNSSKTFFVRVYDSNNNITAIKLAPGAIEDGFIPSNSINKIVIHDHKHSKKTLTAISRNELRKDTAAINNNMIFIIAQDSSIRMYPASTSRDEALQKVDVAYMQKAELPVIELGIHTIKDNQVWTTQKVTYATKDKTSFLGAVQSLFS